MRSSLWRALPQTHGQTVWQTPGAVLGTGAEPPSALVRSRPDLRARVAGHYAQSPGLLRCLRRAVQRRWRLPLASLALMLVLGWQPVQAATLHVGENCTLTMAITAANTDTARGGCPTGSGADTIVLPAGSTQTLTRIHNSTSGPTGLPVIISHITIAGRGSTITRDGAARDFRIFAVDWTGDLTLRETTVSGGSSANGGGIFNFGTLTVINSTISGNSSSANGGGIVNSRILSVTNSTISGNSSSASGGGIFNDLGVLIVTNSTISDNSSGFDGGGIYNNNIGPRPLTVTNSTISGNSSSASGGGIYNYAGPLTITNSSTISGNNSIYNGGGIFNSFRGLLTVTNSTVSGNSSSNYGSGIHNSHTFTVTNSTISDNRGGGIFNNLGILTFTNSTITNSTISGNNGGGIENFSGLLTVTNSTISGNNSIYNGGGIFNNGDGVFNATTLTVTNSTISGNSSRSDGGGIDNLGTLTLVRTLVAGNTANNGLEINNHLGGTVFANNHNLFGVDGSARVAGFTPGTTDIIPPAGVQLVNILVPILIANGGPTLTHALVPGSLAHNPGTRACTNASGPPLRQDQRGVLRPQEGACDIGAYEVLPAVSCNGRQATLVGSAQADVLIGTLGDDVIHGQDGDDILLGRGGNDMLCGGAGNDTLRGGAGNDQIFGEAGNDTLDGGTGEDTCNGNGGINRHAGGCEVLRNLP